MNEQCSNCKKEKALAPHNNTFLLPITSLDFIDHTIGIGKMCFWSSVASKLISEYCQYLYCHTYVLNPNEAKISTLTCIFLDFVICFLYLFWRVRVSSKLCCALIKFSFLKRDLIGCFNDGELPVINSEWGGKNHPKKQALVQQAHSLM